nr:uncharacterized protein LOC107410344 [Ziziphus jujuba var. spinosa]
MYKTKLQELCQRKKWALPCYTSMKDGPDHIPEFKASVVVNGLSFDSPASCKSSKDAHNHAAMLAFLHFTSPSDYVAEYANRSKLPKEEKAAAAKDESGVYKNLLLELTKRECLCMPIYRTTKSDAHSTPTFFSSVEVEGAMFYGMAGKSVKQAEHSAAMIAYKSLNKGGFTHADGFTFPNLNENAAKATSSSKFAVTTDSLQDVKDEILIPYPNFTSQGHSKVKKVRKNSEFALAQGTDIYPFMYHLMLKIQETDSAEKLRAHVKLTSNEDCNTFSATMKKEEKETINAGKQFSFPNPKPSPEELLMSPRSTHPNLFGISDTSYVWNTTRTRNYLLCNRVRVYTEFPDFTFPKGITVLPIAEDKWVAISLEFPNEESN